MQILKNADKLAAFLSSHDRLVLASNLNCAILFYDFYAPNIISFISEPSSLHILSLAQVATNSLCIQTNSPKLEQFKQLNELAPINFGIYESQAICGLCAKARLITCTKEIKEHFFNRYKMARLALGHKVYALEILYAKYKNLNPYTKWEYKNFLSRP